MKIVLRDTSDRCRRLKSLHRYKSKKFAIGAIVKRITRINKNNIVIRVKVNNILQRGKVHLQENREIDLWRYSDCVCPPLKVNQEYLIIGHDEVLLNRLKLSDDSLVSRWSQKWKDKIKRWNKKRKPRKGTAGNCKNSCEKKKSKTRLKCRVEQRDESRTRLKCITHSQNVHEHTQRKNQN